MTTPADAITLLKCGYSLLSSLAFERLYLKSSQAANHRHQPCKKSDKVEILPAPIDFAVPLKDALISSRWESFPIVNAYTLHHWRYRARLLDEKIPTAALTGIRVLPHNRSTNGSEQVSAALIRGTYDYKYWDEDFDDLDRGWSIPFPFEHVPNTKWTHALERVETWGEARWTEDMFKAYMHLRQAVKDCGYDVAELREYVTTFQGYRNSYILPDRSNPAPPNETVTGRPRRAYLEYPIDDSGREVKQAKFVGLPCMNRTRKDYVRPVPSRLCSVQCSAEMTAVQKQVVVQPFDPTGVSPEDRDALLDFIMEDTVLEEAEQVSDDVKLEEPTEYAPNSPALPQTGEEYLLEDILDEADEQEVDLESLPMLPELTPEEQTALEALECLAITEKETPQDALEAETGLYLLRPGMSRLTVEDIVDAYLAIAERSDPRDHDLSEGLRNGLEQHIDEPSYLPEQQEQSVEGTFEAQTSTDDNKGQPTTDHEEDLYSRDRELMEEEWDEAEFDKNSSFLDDIDAESDGDSSLDSEETHLERSRPTQLASKTTERTPDAEEVLPALPVIVGSSSHTNIKLSESEAVVTDDIIEELGHQLDKDQPEQDREDPQYGASANAAVPNSLAALASFDWEEDFEDLCAAPERAVDPETESVEWKHLVAQMMQTGPGIIAEKAETSGSDYDEEDGEDNEEGLPIVEQPLDVGAVVATQNHEGLVTDPKHHEGLVLDGSTTGFQRSDHDGHQDEDEEGMQQQQKGHAVYQFRPPFGGPPPYWDYPCPTTGLSSCSIALWCGHMWYYHEFLGFDVRYTEHMAHKYLREFILSDNAFWRSFYVDPDSPIDLPPHSTGECIRLYLEGDRYVTVKDRRGPLLGRPRTPRSKLSIVSCAEDSETPLINETPSNTEISLHTEIHLSTETPVDTENRVGTGARLDAESLSGTDSPLSTVLSPDPVAPLDTTSPMETETPPDTTTPLDTEVFVDREVPLDTENPLDTGSLPDTESPPETETPLDTGVPSDTAIPLAIETPLDTEHVVDTSASRRHVIRCFGDIELAAPITVAHSDSERDDTEDPIFAVIVILPLVSEESSDELSDEPSDEEADSSVELVATPVDAMSVSNQEDQTTIHDDDDFRMDHLLQVTSLDIGEPWDAAKEVVSPIRVRLPPKPRLPSDVETATTTELLQPVDSNQELDVTTEDEVQIPAALGTAHGQESAATASTEDTVQAVSDLQTQDTGSTGNQIGASPKTSTWENLGAMLVSGSWWDEEFEELCAQDAREGLTVYFCDHIRRTVRQVLGAP